MGFWDTIRGRARPVSNNLDALFGLANAALTLETTIGLQATGVGAVCFRAADGAAFAQTQAEVIALLDADTDRPPIEATRDDFGFTWLVSRQQDLTVLGTDLHAINTSLEVQGFGPSLLCSLATFRGPGEQHAALVYLYKRGTWYPFVPQGTDRRDTLMEFQIRDALTGELPIEPDPQRWLALWGAPGL